MKKNRSIQIVFIVFLITMAFALKTMADTKPSTSTDAKKSQAKAGAGKSKSAKAKNDPDQIHVSADALISDRNANYAEFQGNVVTTQEGSVMISDRLKIFYIQDPNKKKSSKDPNNQGAIEKIIATGNVKIKMEDKTAWADKAVYTKIDDTIFLSGGNPRILSGKSYLSGETIRVNRKTEEVFVNTDTVAKKAGEKPKRVEMNIFTNDPSLKK
ncbi:MAG: LptA/OstA family protein [Desulfobacteraceae bacterium]|jgi:lipopolysaccharide export system protein LptA